VTAGWEEEFARALQGGNILGAATILRGTGEDGWVKAAEYSRAAEIVDGLRPAALVRREWAARLISHPRRVDKVLAAILLSPLARTEPREVERAALRLAQDEDWSVRETAASLVGSLLDGAFEWTLPRAREWVRGTDSRVRRAVVVGAKYAARSRRPERAAALLDLLEPALRDPDDYVRRNLGPFALGDQFLRSYPEETLARLTEWARDDDEVVRWNVAMSFSAASGARVAERAAPILSTLAQDERPLVRRAVAATCRRILRRRPELAEALPAL
jgi:hypothetical protein